MSDTNTFDPAEHTVVGVNEYLAQATDSEKARVLEAEEGGQARVSILEGKEAQAAAADAQEATQEAAQATKSTKGASFAEAAKVAKVDDKGFIGTSPERERTGRADKGLSQANPNIMRGGVIPDPRQGVDDSEALEA